MAFLTSGISGSKPACSVLCCASILAYIGFAGVLGCGSDVETEPPSDADRDASVAVSRGCDPLPAPTGSIIRVTGVNELLAAVSNATPGATILVADGRYPLAGASVTIETQNVTLRSESGDRSAVVLDGEYATAEIVQIAASNVTIADLTLREAYDHPIHVWSTNGSDTNGTRIHNVLIVDPGQQAIKINPVDQTHFTDNGIIECCHIELTDAGRARVRDDCYTGGIDAHRSRGWIVRDNTITGFWCAGGLSEHAVHFWRGSRDTLVERNIMRDNARGVGLGLDADVDGRTYSDNPCPSAAFGYVDHVGGIVRNNFVSASSGALFASEYGFDCGICLWQTCAAAVLSNTVYASRPAFSSIEWRFSRTNVEIKDNLANNEMRSRDGAVASLAGNVVDAQAAWFVDPSAGDLHLTESASPAIDRSAADSRVTNDIDGDERPIGPAPDVGADERR